MSLVIDEALVREILRNIALPDDVKSFDVSFADDSTGEPAVWIDLHVDADNRPSPEKIDRLRAARAAIERRLAEAEAGLWPYVRFVVP